MPKGKLYTIVFASVFACSMASGIALSQGVPRNVPIIGFLSTQPQDYQCRFVDGLRARGYVDGQNIRIHYSFAVGTEGGMPQRAGELEAIPVNIIVATSSSATEAARNATTTIPIVMVTTGDPVGQGFVVALNASRNNITGQSMMAPELGLKQLELLRDLSSTARRVAVLWNSDNGADRETMADLPDAAATLGFELIPIEVRSAQDIPAAFATADASAADSLIVLIDPITIAARTVVIEHVNQRHWPAVYPLAEFVEDGGLLSYGVSFSDLYFGAARYVEMLLNGEQPATMPISQPTTFFLYVNLWAAAAQRIAVPISIQARADRLIEGPPPTPEERRLRPRPPDCP